MYERGTGPDDWAAEARVRGPAIDRNKSVPRSMSEALAGRGSMVHTEQAGTGEPIYTTPLERAYGVLLNMEPPPTHTHMVYVIREVSTHVTFTPRDGETEHDAFLRVCKERGITGVIRHSEPRKI